MKKYTGIRIVILTVGSALAYWAYPPGLLNVSPDSLTLVQAVRASAFVVIVFWTITFAINV